MEAYYDAQLDAEESLTSPAATSILSPEIERFLSELGDKLETDNEE